jgi:hypothetical protein
MSLSSASSYRSPYGSGVLQHGTLTFVAGETCTVPCSSIVATDKVSLRVRTSTAGAAAYAADLTNHVFTIAITAGTGFTVVGVDALYAGILEYTVFSSSLPEVNITSA